VWEVVVARHPEVFVRPLSMEKGRKLAGHCPQRQGGGLYTAETK
jgi:hypothetical protein